MCASRGLSNEEKVACALMGLGQDTAAQILKKLPDAEARRILRAFARVQEISREDQLAIAGEFRKLLKAGDKMVVDGQQFAHDIVAQAFGSDAASGIFAGERTGGDELERLIRELSGNKFIELIEHEHPQTAAYLLARAPADMASDALLSLAEEQQNDLILRVSQLRAVRGEINAELCEILRAAVASQQSAAEQIHGPETVAKILSQLPRASEERLLAELEDVDESMADEIRSLMFTFDDLEKIDTKGMQQILQQTPPDQLVLALKSAGAKVSSHILGSMTKRSAERIQEELAELGRVRLKDVEGAQQAIIDIARKLESEGKIALSSGSGPAEEWV